MCRAAEKQAEEEEIKRHEMSQRLADRERELGRRAAEAEAARDSLSAQLHTAQEEIEELTARMATLHANGGGAGLALGGGGGWGGGGGGGGGRGRSEVDDVRRQLELLRETENREDAGSAGAGSGKAARAIRELERQLRAARNEAQKAREVEEKVRRLQEKVRRQEERSADAAALAAEVAALREERSEWARHFAALVKEGEEEGRAIDGDETDDDDDDDDDDDAASASAAAALRLIAEQRAEATALRKERDERAAKLAVSRQEVAAFANAAARARKALAKAEEEKTLLEEQLRERAGSLAFLTADRKAMSRLVESLEAEAMARARATGSSSGGGGGSGAPAAAVSAAEKAMNDLAGMLKAARERVETLEGDAEKMRAIASPAVLKSRAARIAELEEQEEAGRKARAELEKRLADSDRFVRCYVFVRLFVCSFVRFFSPLLQ